MSTAMETSAAEQLKERLSDPHVTANLNRLLDQLETITFAVESIDGFVRRGEVIADSLAEGVAELKQAEEATPPRCWRRHLRC